MTNLSLKSFLLDHLVQQARQVLAWQNADGSFGTFPFVNAQYPFYTLALLWKQPAGHEWAGAQAVHEANCRAMERFMETIDAEGQHEFIGMDGFSWGKVLVGDWPVFCWQETLRLLENDLPAGFYSR